MKQPAAEIIKLLIIVRLLKKGECTIGGLSYMDPLSVRPIPNEPHGHDPCKPLYWYPRPIPDYCFYSPPRKPPPPPLQPIPMPIPVHVPMPPPVFIPPMPMFAPPMLSPIFPQPISPPMVPPMFPPPVPIPYGVPLAPTNPMVPASGIPYRYYGVRPQSAMVPGLPGLVSRDGGINILPFSDAYSDLLEKHKQKMIRKRLEKVLDEYNGFPYKRHKPRGNW